MTHGRLPRRLPRGEDRPACIVLAGRVPARAAAPHRDGPRRPGPSWRRRSATPGPWPTPGSNGAASLAPTRSFSPMGSMSRAASERRHRRGSPATTVGAAAVALEAGFDSIEVHLGHNYLLSAFLSPKLNRRRDEWGGSLENRARFARQVVRGRPGGRRRTVRGDGQAEHGRRRPRGSLARRERRGRPDARASDGCLDALELTGGSSLANPMYLFRGEAPLPEFAATLRQPSEPASGSSASVPSATTRSRRPSSCPTPASSARAVDLPLILSAASTARQTIDHALDRGLRVRRHGPSAAARARSGEPHAEGTKPTSPCASTATSACPPSTGARAASWSRRPAPDAPGRSVEGQRGGIE